MKYRILRWLLGIWLVETVAARHIQRDDEHVGNVENRFARDQSHRTFLPDSHLNYNAFRTPIRRAPPQVPGRHDGIEPHNQYSNYFGGNTNDQNLYSAVRLHGALEVRARAEPGSNTLVSNNGHQNYYNQQDSQNIPERHFRRDTVDEDSAEREDDLARFSLYNSYFDNEHSIKALNSMKCVTPTGSPGFCSTFRGCVPSFFTKEGDLEAPALAELISTSIGYCTTNVSHHFIREQRQHAVSTSREDRRFNSVANRIICCPGTAPPRDSNQDPDKIFNDYLESQKNKHKTTTTTTTEQPQEPENAIDGSDNSVNQNQPDAGAQGDGVSSPVDGQVSNESGSQTAPDAQQQPSENQNVEAPEQPSEGQNVEAPEQPSEGQNVGAPEQPSEGQNVEAPEQPSEGQNVEAPEMPSDTQNVAAPEQPNEVDNNEAPAQPIDSQNVDAPEQPSGGQNIEAPADSSDTSILPEQTLPVNEPAPSATDQNQQESSSMNPEETDMINKPAMSEDAEPSQSQQNEAAQTPAEGSEVPLPPQHTIPDGASEESPAPPEEQAVPVNQENQSLPPSSAANDEATPGSEQSQPSPENPNQPKPVHPPGEQGVGVPGDTMVDSKPIIIVTNPMLPASGNEDVDVVGMMPEEMMPTFPQFPGEFPPMGSAENPIPPVDDSSLELQQRPVARPTPDKPMMVENEVISSSTTSPSSSSSVSELPQTTLPAINDDNQMNDEVTTASSNMQYAPGHTDYYEKIPMTTNEPEESVVATTQRIISSGDLQMQQGENDAPLITTSQPAISDSASEASQGISASSDSITTSSSSPSNENDENGAVTILPEVSGGSMTGSTEKSGPTTQIPVEADFMTTIKSQPGAPIEQQQQQQGVNEITTISSGSVDPQGVEVTTIRQAASAGSQEAIETTTFGFIKAQTTLTPDDDESSEESDEDIRQQPTTVANQADAASDDDIQRTTVAASSNLDLGPTTTSPILAEVSDQEEESLPVTQPSTQQQQNENEIYSTTPRIVPAAQDQDDEVNSSNNVQEGTSLPPDSESNSVGAEYTTPVPPQSASQTGESEDTSKIILNPGSEISEQPAEDVKGGSVPTPVGGGSHGKPEIGTDDVGQQQASTGDASETMQPFPVSSPAPTGEDQSSQQGSDDSTNNPQLIPGSESGAGAANTESPLQDPEQPIPESEPESIAEPAPTSGAEQQQPFPEGASTTTGPSSFDDEQSIPGTEQSLPASETSSPSESSQTTNDRESTRLPTTGSPNASGTEQDEAAEAEPTVGSEAPGTGSEQASATGGGASTDGYPVSSPGSDATGATSESSNYPGVSTISDGSEPSTPGSESLITGTESSVSGSETSTSGGESSTQGADSSGSGTEESFIPNPGSESSSGSQSASPGQGSGSSPSTGDNGSSSVSPVEPAESASDSQPPVPEPAADDANASDNELPISSSSPAAPTTDGPAATESVSQDAVPSVPSEPTEDAPSMQGPAESADSPISSDHVQNPEPVISTTQAPQDVSSPAPIVSSTTEPSLMQELSTEPAIIPPKEIVPNYQILKACKFQSFFRSASEQGYSYRHYPWLATIVGGTRPFSSGTLITDRHILTASHFLANITVSDVFNMRIHIGYRTSYSGQTEGPYAVRKVRKVIRHKGFSFEKLYNDIAVLVLDRPVRFTEDIYPVCLSSNRNAYADGTAEAVETGWIEDPRTYHISQHHNYIDPHIQKYFSFGYKNITWRLQEAPLRVRTNLECQSNYGFLEKNGIGVTDSMVCAGTGDTKSCAFRGNSGAPLFIRNDNDKMSEQIGIVSWSIGCSHFPNVFTRVESFLPWLDRVVYNSR